MLAQLNVCKFITFQQNGWARRAVNFDVT
jgi:hypothetical protein